MGGPTLLGRPWCFRSNIIGAVLNVASTAVLAGLKAAFLCLLFNT